MTVAPASKLISDLQLIIDEDPQSIKAAIAQEALAYESPADFFHNLIKHGCVSGMVSNLVWYSQTHQFFDKHYDEIDDMRMDYEEATGQQIQIKHDLKNFFAWFAFEEVAYQLASELGLEI